MSEKKMKAIRKACRERIGSTGQDPDKRKYILHTHPNKNRQLFNDPKGPRAYYKRMKKKAAR